MFDFAIIKEVISNYIPGAGGFAIIVYLLHKIATNHLKHIADDIKDLGKKIDIVDMNVMAMKESHSDSLQRISRLEGKLE